MLDCKSHHASDLSQFPSGARPGFRSRFAVEPRLPRARWRPARPRSWPSRSNAASGSVSVFRTATPAARRRQRRDQPALRRAPAEVPAMAEGRLARHGGGRPAPRRLSRRASTRPPGSRAFDYEFMGERVYGRPMAIESVALRRRRPKRKRPQRRWAATWRAAASASTWARATANAPPSSTARWSSATRCAWNPSAQTDPQYHFDGIHDSLQRAAAHLPRVDAIGGSAAGVYVDNEVRVGSLYRSVPRGPVRQRASAACSSNCSAGLGRHSRST